LAELERGGAFRDRGARLVAISVDPADESRPLARELSIDFPLLTDEGLRIARDYGVADEDGEIAVPAVFVVDQGHIAWRMVASHIAGRASVEEILAALDAL
jgi:peroxiredoxin